MSILVYILMMIVVSIVCIVLIINAIKSLIPARMISTEDHEYDNELERSKK